MHRHERLEEAFWVKMEKKLDELEDKFDCKFNSLENRVETLANRRARDNGFISGTIFILTGLGALVGAALTYFIK